LSPHQRRRFTDRRTRGGDRVRRAGKATRALGWGEILRRRNREDEDGGGGCRGGGALGRMNVQARARAATGL